MIVYTSSTCAFCPQLKKWLNSRGYEYTEKSIEDQENLKELLKLSGISTVPVTIVNNHPYLGLDLGGIAKAMHDTKTM
jgi:glutaredoxin